MDKPDFEALRKLRNGYRKAREEQMRAEGFIPLGVGCAYNADDACYCACSTGGPCEHTWDGPTEQFGDGLGWSATCSRCGMLSYSHSLRNDP
jgi:hypothetical protein